MWGAQCGMPSVRCPVCGAQCPVKGHYWTPGARRKKGGWLGRPGQARPQGSRTSQGSGPDSFHSSFSFRIFLVNFFISIPLSFFSQNSPVRRAKVHFPWWWFILPLVHPSGLSLLWKCFPAPTSNKYWKRFLSWATIPYHTISFLGRPDKKQWRTKGRMVAGDMADQETKSEENQQNKGERGSW